MIGPDETAEPWTESPGRPPRALDDVLHDLASARGWTRRLDGARVHGLWTEIAGEGLAQHAEPVRLHGGVLVVRASSPAWATQIRYLAQQLIERADEVLGPGTVTKVVVKRDRETS